MKRLISVFLCLILAFGCAGAAFAADASGGSFGAYKRVIIVGIDGAGRFIKDAETPNFDRIFKDGSVDYTARAETKTDSGPNWSAMLTGVSNTLTGLENGVVGSEQRTSETAYPTIFTDLRQAMPDAELASFVNWAPINNGIIETDVGVNKVDIQSDEALTEAICAYFDAGNQPTLFFVQLDEVDGAGHGNGSASEEYFNAIKIADDRLGRIYDAADRNGLLDDALFIVAADHGHTRKGGHGGLTMRETNVTVAVAGKTVAAGGKMDRQTRNRDIAAIALYALGMERPDRMSARVPANVFSDVKGERRSFFADPKDAFISALAWCLTIFTALV